MRGEFSRRSDKNQEKGERRERSLSLSLSPLPPSVAARSSGMVVTHLFPCLLRFLRHWYDAKTAVVVRTHSVPVSPPPPLQPPRPELHSPSPVLKTPLMMIRRPSTRVHRHGDDGGGVASDFCDCLADCLEIRRCCRCSSRTRPRIRQTLSVCGRYSRLWGGDYDVGQFRLVKWHVEGEQSADSLISCGSSLRCLRFPRSTGLECPAWPSLGVGVCPRSLWTGLLLRVQPGLESESG